MGKCGKCRQVIPSVCIDPPQPCEGTPCSEVMNTACVIYDGPDIECLGIQTGMTMNQILQVLANVVCEPNSDIEDRDCYHPLRWILSLAFDLRDIIQQRDSLNYIDFIFHALFFDGMVMNNCGFCCPSFYLNDDVSVYGLLYNVHVPILNGMNLPSNQQITDFDRCYQSLTQRCPDLIEEFEKLVEGGHIENRTSLCVLNNVARNCSDIESVLSFALKYSMTIICFRRYNIINFTTLLNAIQN